MPTLEGPLEDTYNKKQKLKINTPTHKTTRNKTTTNPSKPNINNRSKQNNEKAESNKTHMKVSTKKQSEGTKIVPNPQQNYD